MPTLSHSKILAKSSSRIIEVHGHRGARARFPENTLPAFDYALKVGVDYLELDMGISKDNVVVISHDQHINPVICLDPDGKTMQSGPLIHSLNLDEIKKYDCGAVQNPKFTKQQIIKGTRIPTLAEVFEMVQKSPHPSAANVRFNIESKIDPENPDNTVDPESFVDLFLAVVQKYNMQKRVVLQSFDYRTLEALRKKDPKIQRSALTESKFRSSRDIIHETTARMISPLWWFANSIYVNRMHDIGVQVIPWTANSASQWSFLVNSEVDAIISDDPEPLLQFLRNKGMHP